MKGYVEKMISEYPKMVREREHLKKQIERCEFLSADELICAMSFSHPDGERVQSSDLSDKTARIAIGYHEKLDRINEDLVVPMQKRYNALDEEISFLENTIDELPVDMQEAMHELVIEGLSWEDVAASLYISITKLQKLRRAAIDTLVRAYQKRESQIAGDLLS
jgi:DNA-directed RNA polymerase specialized sigma24 family protein